MSTFGAKITITIRAADGCGLNRTLATTFLRLLDLHANPFQFRACQQADAPVLGCAVQYVSDVRGSDQRWDGTLGIEDSGLAALRAGNGGVVYRLCSSEGSPAREWG